MIFSKFDLFTLALHGTIFDMWLNMWSSFAQLRPAVFLGSGELISILVLIG